MPDDYTALLSAIAARPVPYAPMAFSFWDDPYISRQFLAAHLSPDTDGASRKPAYLDKSADWIASIARGDLLDLGCGPGLYAERFARRGFTVTGVDLSERSIEHARASAEGQGLSIRYLRQNYLDIDFQDAFDIAVLIYCDYGVLPPADRAAVLTNVRRALRPGGLFLLDAWTPAKYAEVQNDWTAASAPDGGFWSPDPYAALSRAAAYPDNIHLERHIVVTANEVRDYNVWNTAFDRASLSAELADAGFEGGGVYGDVAGATYTRESPTICVIARA